MNNPSEQSYSELQEKWNALVKSSKEPETLNSIYSKRLTKYSESTKELDAFIKRHEKEISPQYVRDLFVSLHLIGATTQLQGNKQKRSILELLPRAKSVEGNFCF